MKKSLFVLFIFLSEYSFAQDLSAPYSFMINETKSVIKSECLAERRAYMPTLVYYLKEKCLKSESSDIGVVFFCPDDRTHYAVFKNKALCQRTFYQLLRTK